MIRVKAVQVHQGEGQFPTFSKGAAVTLVKERGTRFLHWLVCEIEGYETYVPENFVSDGKLIRDYDPTELVLEIGDVLEVREIVFAWLLAVNEKGVSGWIPAEAVISVVYA